MDISTAAFASIKTPEAETRIQPITPLSAFTNGVLKRHHHLNPPPGTADVTYKECLKNHAATMGGHAVDGCGEFMASPSADPSNPALLKCAACGCHRNFHRREPEEPPPPSAQHVIEFQPHHRHQPPPPRGHTSPNSASPPPISSSYMLLALSGGGLSVPAAENNPSITTHAITGSYPNGRKRFRTKFSQNQKERMLQFAERVGWKMQRKDEELISCFCGEIGVEKDVFKVWMHNNKSTFGKRNGNMENGNSGNRNSTFQNTHTNYHYQDKSGSGSASAQVVAGNGSSSSC